MRLIIPAIPALLLAISCPAFAMAEVITNAGGFTTGNSTGAAPSPAVYVPSVGPVPIDEDTPPTAQAVVLNGQYVAGPVVGKTGHRLHSANPLYEPVVADDNIVEVNPGTVPTSAYPTRADVNLQNTTRADVLLGNSRYGLPRTSTSVGATGGALASGTSFRNTPTFQTVAETTPAPAATTRPHFNSGHFRH